MRSYRARIEKARVAEAGRAGSFVLSGATGGTYFVDLVDDSGADAACSCPDFLLAMLGTCKHVEAVRLAMVEGRFLAPSLREPVLTARSDGRLRLAAIGPNAASFIARLGGRVEASGDVIATPAMLAAHGATSGAGGYVTHAAIAAAKILEQRRERAERTATVKEALSRDELAVDVLALPLFPYQKAGVAHLVAAGRAVLADDMGLGKTVQTLAACEVLRRRGEAKRILVVCPATLKAQWASEIARTTGASAVVVGGAAEARRAALASDAPYVVLNYELTWRDLSTLRSVDTDVLVLDEAQRARNFRTKTAATLRSIPSRFLFVLTGTPVENKLDDLYGILQLVDPEILGPLWRFNLAFHHQDETGRVVGYKNLRNLRTTIAPVVLRRRKEDVLSQLPALTELTRYVALSGEQTALEESYRRAAAALLHTAERRACSPGEQRRLQAALLKARQACNAAVLCDRDTTDKKPAKIEELGALVGEIAAQGTSKMLVFSEWTEMLLLAAKKLDEMGVGYVMLHGDVPTARRDPLVERFRTDDAQVVMLSTDAGGVGLNLQSASYVVHLDLPWNPARLDQRIGRAHRLGQTRGVSVTYLCAESGLERAIEGTLRGKRAVRGAAVDDSSDVDTLEAPTFAAFLREARDVLSPNGARAIAAVPATPRRELASLRTTEPFARQRLRLAQVVLSAGFFGDAVRAAYEAVAASLRARLDPSLGAAHADLVAAVYAELLPSGAIPSTLPSVLAKIHDLAVLGEQGLPIDPEIATSAVEDARAWLERDDTFR
jgi:superfamily II DNA or RNA helicase